MFSVHFSPETGDADAVECLQADPVIEISDQVLENGNAAFLNVSDGIATFHCVDGDISYGLKAHDEFRECWLAMRSGVIDEDFL